MIPDQQNQPINIPEKFRDPESGAVNTDSLLKSYLELEKRLSAQPGCPASPEEYEVDTSHGLFTADPDINGKLHEKGFTTEQVQAVYDLAAEKFVPMILELAGEFQADREVERLVSAFGGKENWAEVSRQLLAYGKQNLPADVLENLSSSFEGVMMLYRMIKGEGGDRPGLGREQGSAPKGEGDLRSMMRDPRYWKQRDPAFVAKVTEGFKSMYGEG